MKVLVCGGRDFSNADFIFSELDRLHGIYRFTLLVEGDARGVDRISGEWAQSRGIGLVKYPADWQRHGRHAALIRNEHMLSDAKPDLVIAFPGGGGTSHACWKAEQAAIPVVKVAEKRGK